MDNNIFAERIKSLRQELKLSQAGFANLISTNQSTLSAYETGDRLPPYETLVAIAQQCQVSIDWLCGLSDKQSSSSSPKTYTDLIQVIMDLKEAPEICIEWNIDKFDDFGYNYSKLVCKFDDEHLVSFYEEWNDILSVCKKSPSGEKLYQIWVKDIFERFNFPLERKTQDPDNEISF